MNAAKILGPLVICSLVGLLLVAVVSGLGTAFWASIGIGGGLYVALVLLNRVEAAFHKDRQRQQPKYPPPRREHRD